MWIFSPGLRISKGQRGEGVMEAWKKHWEDYKQTSRLQWVLRYDEPLLTFLEQSMITKANTRILNGIINLGNRTLPHSYKQYTIALSSGDDIYEFTKTQHLGRVGYDRNGWILRPMEGQGPIPWTLEEMKQLSEALERFPFERFCNTTLLKP